MFLTEYLIWEKELGMVEKMGEMGRAASMPYNAHAQAELSGSVPKAGRADRQFARCGAGKNGRWKAPLNDPMGSLLSCVNLRGKSCVALSNWRDGNEPLMTTYH